MKKNFVYALMSAIALVGAVSLTSCSSSDDVEVNPTFDPEANTVTTNFVLNVAYADPSATPTRQSSTTVQKATNFRGLKDAKLIALGTGNSNLAPYAGATTGAGYVKKVFDLGTLYSSTAITPANNQNGQGTTTNTGSHRVLQLELPIGADAMLVYARAVPSGDVEEDGKVDISLNDNPESTTFKLVSRLKGSTASGIADKSTEYNQTLNLTALILNRIMLSEISSMASGYSHNNIAQEDALPAVKWSEITGTGNGLPALLEQAYLKMGVRAGEKRNGSSKGVRDQAADIYKTVTAVLSATATDDVELNAQRLAAEIKARIEKYFDVTSTSFAFNSIGNATSSGTIVYALVTAQAVANQDAYNTLYSTVTNDDLAGFPGSFGIPEGAAVLKANTTADGPFVYVNSTTDTDHSLLAGSTTSDKYMYPAELLYFDNSALYVSDAEKAESNYPDGYKTWDEYSWTGNSWKLEPVSSSTLSVAVKNNINYGVAMLQTKVGFATLEAGGKYEDNRNHITGEANQSLTTAQMTGFKLTGVLIGNQSNQLDWKYLASGGSNDNVIYDKKIPESFDIPTSEGNENYTLVFDNWVSGNTQTSDVYVALEFQNNSGVAFFGNENLIPIGSTFYLVGKLTLASGTGTLSWDPNYAIPPYASGASTETRRVFIQNYMTKATFNIGATSLQKAYLTVPDLRSTQMSLGLSVDLSWKEGLTFTSTLGN